MVVEPLLIVFGGLGQCWSRCLVQLPVLQDDHFDQVGEVEEPDNFLCDLLG